MDDRNEVSVDHVHELSRSDLATEWARIYRAPTPSLSPELLRLGIAHRLQSKRKGGLKPETKRLLTECSRAAQEASAGYVPTLARKLTPGTKLVRDWRGAGYVVTVLEEGFDYDGKTWRSLSAIAKAITGTHRNGPRFFGVSK